MPLLYMVRLARGATKTNASKLKAALKDTLHIWNRPKYRKDIYRCALDADKLKYPEGHESFTVALQRIPVKNSERATMADLVANKPLQRDQIAAFYKMRVFRTIEKPDDPEHYSYPYGSTYTFNVYGKNGKRLKCLIGDISPESVPGAEGNVPYWGHFANEPDRKEDANVRADRQVKRNFGGKKRKALMHGDYIVYALVATRDIEKGESLRFCYGCDYLRDYSTGCASAENTVPSFGATPPKRKRQVYTQTAARRGQRRRPSAPPPAPPPLSLPSAAASCQSAPTPLPSAAASCQSAPTPLPSAAASRQSAPSPVLSPSPTAPPASHYIEHLFLPSDLFIPVITCRCVPGVVHVWCKAALPQDHLPPPTLPSPSVPTSPVTVPPTPSTLPSAPPCQHLSALPLAAGYPHHHHHHHSRHPQQLHYPHHFSAHDHHHAHCQCQHGCTHGDNRHYNSRHHRDCHHHCHRRRLAWSSAPRGSQCGQTRWAIVPPLPPPLPLPQGSSGHTCAPPVGTVLEHGRARFPDTMPDGIKK